MRKVISSVNYLLFAIKYITNSKTRLICHLFVALNTVSVTYGAIRLWAKAVVNLACVDLLASECWICKILAADIKLDRMKHQAFYPRSVWYTLLIRLSCVLPQSRSKFTDSVEKGQWGRETVETILVDLVEISFCSQSLKITCIWSWTLTENNLWKKWTQLTVSLLNGLAATFLYRSYRPGFNIVFLCKHSYISLLLYTSTQLTTEMYFL